MKVTAARMRWGAVCAALALGLAACGDAQTADDRGYTKAPLEDPGLTIEAEESTVMDELGDPDPLAPLGQPDDTTGAADAATADAEAGN